MHRHPQPSSSPLDRKTATKRRRQFQKKKRKRRRKTYSYGAHPRIASSLNSRQKHLFVRLVCAPIHTSRHSRCTRRHQDRPTRSVGAALTHARQKAIAPNGLWTHREIKYKKGQSCSPVNLSTISSPSRWCCPRSRPCTFHGCVHSCVLAS